MKAHLAAVGFAALTNLLSGGLVATGVSAAPANIIALAPHRAVYDLRIIRTRGAGSIEGVRGRILYDFTGSACAGYELQFRQVSELNSGDGNIALSDLRSKSWEHGAAKKFRFSSENRLNERVVDKVEGSADRRGDGAMADLTLPKRTSVPLPAGVVFPTEHMRRVIDAARAGKPVLELVVYDGSESGEKLYDTLTVIGRKIEPGDKPPDDAAAKETALAKLVRWPVTISYFEKKKDGKREEQMPVYSISFEVYENGISRALVLDYTDFTIAGTMTSLEMKTAKPCN